ncbi:MAG TPA: hypothetical protein VL688_09895 [Verrucomicrobiae bacterium]|jgi:hypothetical protein|nr:hypothetical protein [Verrucomicrobiae bacterium]
MDGQISAALLKVRVERLREAFSELEDELARMTNPKADDVRVLAHTHKDELDTLRDILMYTETPDPASLKLISQQLGALKEHYHKVMRKWVRLISHEERLKRKLAA